jgi:hypothetical protein
MEEELIDNSISSSDTLSRTSGSKKIHPAVRCGGRLVTCSKLENKCYTTKHQEKQKHTRLDWLKK